MKPKPVSLVLPEAFRGAVLEGIVLVAPAAGPLDDQRNPKQRKATGPLATGLNRFRNTESDFVSDHSPMIGGIAGRYAQALFDLARDAGNVDRVESDLNGLKQAMADSADLRRFVTSPVFSREEQAAGMAAILEKAGVDDLTRRFVGLVARNRRLFALPGMINAFAHLAAEDRGEITASVTSARSLDETQQKNLRAALKTALGQDVNLQMDVDPDLLGGLVVKVGSRMIDTSIRTKLNNLKIAMKEAG